MSDKDFDNGPGEEELREMLRSLPRREAPGDFEPELMRRIAGIRRRRGLLSVLHTAARAEWVGGLVSAATAAMVVAGTWVLMVSQEAKAPALRSAPPVVELPMVWPQRAEASATPTAEATASTAAASAASANASSDAGSADVSARESRRSVSTAHSSRRPMATSARRRTAAIAKTRSRTIDTIAATRLQRRPVAPTPTPTGAGSRTPHPESGQSVKAGQPAPAPTLHGEPTGVDTGGRGR